MGQSSWFKEKKPVVIKIQQAVNYFYKKQIILFPSALKN
jgi:hypothetical protein